MIQLLNRLRSLMASKSKFPMIIYNEGEISQVAGDFTTNGYKYGENFDQSKQATYLKINSTSIYNIRGGRTFTTQNQIPASCIGKTLRVIGTQTNTETNNMRNSVFRAYISEQVVDNDQVEVIANSGCFVNSIYATQAINGENTTINIDLSLSITQIGYVSIVGYKGYAGKLDVRISKIWIE